MVYTYWNSRIEIKASYRRLQFQKNYASEHKNNLLHCLSLLTYKIWKSYVYCIEIEILISLVRTVLVWLKTQRRRVTSHLLLICATVFVWFHSSLSSVLPVLQSLSVVLLHSHLPTVRTQLSSHIFIKYSMIFKILSLTNKVIIKSLTTPQMLCYTTVWNITVRMNSPKRFDTVLVVLVTFLLRMCSNGKLQALCKLL